MDNKNFYTSYLLLAILTLAFLTFFKTTDSLADDDYEIEKDEKQETSARINEEAVSEKIIESSKTEVLPGSEKTNEPEKADSSVMTENNRPEKTVSSTEIKKSAGEKKPPVLQKSSQLNIINIPVLGLSDQDQDGVPDYLDLHPKEDDFAYLIIDHNHNGIADELEALLK